MEPHPETESIVSEIPERTTGRVLLVDDDAAVLDVTKSLLEHLGYQVTATRCSSEALQLFKAEPTSFDLMITDVVMPRMRGDELAHTIRGIRPGMPVILATGFCEDALEKAKALGIRDYILKPFLLQDLAGAILKALGKRPDSEDFQDDDRDPGDDFSHQPGEVCL